MLKNYLVTALRILWRQKTYSAINVLGLTLGIACSLLIVIYITDELGYDKFHRDAGRIYRVGFRGIIQGREFSSALTGFPMSETLQSETPQVESAIHIEPHHTYPVRYEDKSFTENKFLFADSNFFQFFDFKLVTGNPSTVLKGPNKIVISENAAKKYFDYKGHGDVSPLGKILVLGSGGERTAEVTGIVEDTPNNSHIKFDFLLSFESWKGESFWLSSDMITYFKLKPGATIESVDEKYSYFVEKYCGVEIEKFLSMSLKQFSEQGGKVGFFSTPFLDIHLKSHETDELEPNGNLQYLYLFGAIAFFIILLACINFMNLSTARSANRAKEVGVRKTIGALKHRLLGQFLMESCLYSVIAIVLAIIFVVLAMPSFNILTGKVLTAAIISHPYFIVSIFLFTIFVGLLAGSYPAFYLTSFKPVDVLKGKVRAGMRSSGIRNFLVVFQFVISITLIISTLMVYKQLKYVQNQNLG
ncbi:MAG: ABC transporter permease, partial [Bacteroidia bacterium]|nr:ABC transporter permease [Bacteroidia bacterium]